MRITTADQARIAAIRERIKPAPTDPNGAARDTHTEHCCRRHGCKYGRLDCTVWKGSKVQSFPCEVCGDDTIRNAELVWLLDQLSGAAADSDRLDFIEARTRNHKAPNFRVWGDEIEVTFFRDPFNPRGIGKNIREAIDATR